jgi:hypothetical protein
MADFAELERRLWAAADELRANSSLTPAGANVCPASEAW